MAIDAKMIKELREITGMGITDCKKALVEANGSMEDAEMLLRKKGLDKAAKKADRATGEGVIKVEIRDNIGIIIEVQCEQEPTTNNERFLSVVNDAVETAFATGVKSAEELVQAECGGEKIEDKIKAVIGVIGENVVIKRLVRVESDAESIIGSYSHFNNKSGAISLVKFAGCSADAMKSAADDVCMHAVAVRPISLNRDGVPADMVAKEKEVFMEEVKNKPENIQDKILEGKLSKFYGEKCLNEQVFVKDPDGKMTVAAMIEKTAKDAGGSSAEIVEFARFELGN